MEISLRGETVLVTGAAVRVGRAIALECARAGASVAITYNHSAGEAKETLAELRQAGGEGARFAALRADVSVAADVAHLKAQVVDELGGVTALVNNAAVFRRTPFAEMTEADFDDHIAANLKGPYLMCKAFGDLFLEQGRGAIVNIADINAMRPLKNYIPYCVSKAGVIMLTRTLAKALAPRVRVNCICPGTILLPSEPQDDGAKSGNEEETLLARIPLHRFGTPQEIAQCAVFLIGGPQFITGAVLPVDGGELVQGRGMGDE